MASGIPWGKFALITAGCTGLGYVIMRVTVPSEDELYRRMSPDIRRKVDLMREQRQRTEALARGETLPEAPALQKPDPEKPHWAGR